MTATRYWQTEYYARRRTKAAYRAPLFCVDIDHRVPCIAHGILQKTRDTVLHHLNEYGKGHEECWFFENLVPICPDDNAEIESSRKSKTPLATSEDFSPQALLARSLSLYYQGEHLRAYGCARLGSFLAWGPGRPGWEAMIADPNPTVELASQCLLCFTSCRSPICGSPGH